MLATHHLHGSFKSPSFDGEILLVGAGGSGAVSRAGGGGAGGVRYVATIALNTSDTYTLQVGVGGAAAPTWNLHGNNGEASYIKVPSGSGLDGAVGGVQVYIGYGGGGGTPYDRPEGSPVAKAGDATSDPIDSNTLGSSGGGSGASGVAPTGAASSAGGAGASYDSGSVIGTHRTQGTVGGLQHASLAAGGGGGGAGGRGGSANAAAIFARSLAIGFIYFFNIFFINSFALPTACTHFLIL